MSKLDAQLRNLFAGEICAESTPPPAKKMPSQGTGELMQVAHRFSHFRWKIVATHWSFLIDREEITCEWDRMSFDHALMMQITFQIVKKKLPRMSARRRSSSGSVRATSGQLLARRPQRSLYCAYRRVRRWLGWLGCAIEHTHHNKTGEMRARAVSAAHPVNPGKGKPAAAHFAPRGPRAAWGQLIYSRRRAGQLDINISYGISKPLEADLWAGSPCHGRTSHRLRGLRTSRRLRVEWICQVEERGG